MQKYAVMGNPIAHSKSPIIHQAFAAQFDLKISYERILVSPGELAMALHVFQNKGGCGVNITLPLKEEAFGLVQELLPHAQQAKAVNTLTFTGLNLYRGENTDGIGLVRDLCNNQQIILKNKRLLILGAGGATRGILGPLLEQQPASLIIANRTLSKAEQLLADFSYPKNLCCCEFGELSSQKFDLIINATSASTKGESLSLPSIIAKDTVCYDLSYGTNAVPFLSWAQASSATRCLDGLGMLVEQAAEAFYLWHGKRPNTQAIIPML